MYKLLRSLVAHKKPGEFLYSNLVKVLTKHYNPKPSKIAHWCKFHSRQWQRRENIATCVTQLHFLAQTCAFGISLYEMIRDSLVHVGSITTTYKTGYDDNDRYHFMPCVDRQVDPCYQTSPWRERNSACSWTPVQQCLRSHK